MLEFYSMSTEESLNAYPLQDEIPLHVKFAFLYPVAPTHQVVILIRGS